VLMNVLLKNIVYHAPWLLSDRRNVELQWKLRTGRDLDLDNPRTFNEKIQWLKVFDHRADYKILADKIEAKEFAQKVIGAEHIIPTLAVYDKVSDIDWDKLPDEFVLKCSHDSGGLVICRDKQVFDKSRAAGILSRCLKKNFYLQSREWCYKGIRPRIICETLMSDSDQRESLVDYKFFCFGGVPEFMYISQGLENHNTARISFVDMSGGRMPFRRSDYASVGEIVLPSAFDEMKQIAAKLARAVDNRFVRVDLYQIGGKVYFSEFTFYPNGGFIPFEPSEWDLKIGGMLQL